MDLQLHDIKVSVEQGQCSNDILNIPDFKLTRGKTLGVFGPSGAGKTTLLQVLGGLLSSGTKGELLWGEYDLNTMSEKQKDNFRQDNMGFIFQFPKLFDHLGACDNILMLNGFRKRKISQPEIKNIFERLGLSCGNRLVKFLSGGEKQRLALARAIIHCPKILLADEPTASLDKNSRDQVINLLSEITKEMQMTLVLVSHDEKVKNIVDDQIYLQDGRIQ